MTRSWLITGGAGYIGSHVTHELRRRGHETVILDDLSTGRIGRIAGPYVIGSVADRDLLIDTIRTHRVTGVVHLAGSKQVAESVISPEHYYANNVAALLTLLDAMVGTGVDRIVFSSSASVYGNATGADISEDDSASPINPYGRSKLIGEWAIRDYGRAHNLRHAILRYFNVAGTAHPVLADANSTNLIPQVIAALLANVEPVIYGTDYDTPDGTCVRDFVDVRDLAHAHADAIALLDRPNSHYTLNVGSGHGYSVKETVEAVLALAGSRLTPRLLPRRLGDPDNVIAATRLITATTGWTPRYSLDDMIKSTLSAATHSPHRVRDARRSLQLVPPS